MRTVARVLFHFQTATLLLIGCDSEHPVEPLADADIRPLAALASGSTPAAPSNLSAVGTSTGQIDITWQDNASNETWFEIVRALGATGPFVLLPIKIAPNIEAYSQTGLQSATQYCFRVRSVRENGGKVFQSAFSNVACATTPGVPNAATAVIVLGRTLQVYSSSLVQVQWTHTTYNVDGFRIERSADGGPPWDVVTTVSPGERSASLDVAPEQSHCFRVIAFNAVGDAPASNTTDCTSFPAAPTNLTLTAFGSQTIGLTWRDNSGMEDGYEVWLSWLYAPSCDVACDAVLYHEVALVADLPANSTSFSTQAHLAYPYGTVAYLVVAKKNGSYSDPTMVDVTAP